MSGIGFLAALAVAGSALAEIDAGRATVELAAEPRADAAEATAAELTPASINTAFYSGQALPDGESALTARIQILLDRNNASPGAINGRKGDNLRRAIRGFEAMHDLPVDGVMDDKVWQWLSHKTEPAIVLHRITREDLSDIVDALPEDYRELSKRKWLGYTSPAEKIAERFHMDLAFLRLLNPRADFSNLGTEIWVADPGDRAKSKVTRVLAKKSKRELWAFDARGRVVAAYPVTVGSSETPSPDGTHKVKSIARKPTYTYRPSDTDEQGNPEEPLQLPPGPNGPVGIVWIGLTKPTFGIHGVAEPERINTDFSQGCVRMTNWDALELASLVSTGVPVEFQD